MANYFFSSDKIKWERGGNKLEVFFKALSGVISLNDFIWHPNMCKRHQKTPYTCECGALDNVKRISELNLIPLWAFRNKGLINHDEPNIQPIRDSWSVTTEPAYLGLTELLENYSSVQILTLLAALQLHPENHGRNVRFEQLVREALLHFSPDDKKPIATWEQLKEVIENYTVGSYEEDPLTNAFTENAIFENGNYIVYSGIYVGFTEILNQLTECIFLQQNKLEEEFVKRIRSAVGLLLFMCDSAARDAHHIAYIYQESDTGNIEFPDYDTTVQYTEAILFSKELLNIICERCGYDIAILDDFILQPGAPELQNDDPQENVVNFKPIIDLYDRVLLYMPSGLTNALVSYIYQKAKEFNCYDELLDSFYARQFHLSCLTLASKGWLATDIALPPLKDSLPIREMVFQFDNQKFGYVCFVQPNNRAWKDIAAQPTEKTTYSCQERNDEVVKYLKNINIRQSFGVLCLHIIAESGQDHFFAWSKPTAGNQSLALTYRELWTIMHSSHVNSLTLWKFAKCYRRTNELMNVMSMGGTLDAYSIYRENYGSLMDSDEVNPLGGMLLIANGSSSNFRREIQKQQNEHAVPIFYNGQSAFAKVTRFKDYAPIYVGKEVSNSFRIVIETYKMPIWVTNPQTQAGRETWGTYVCEAVAFWLYKMAPFLSPYFSDLRLIQFEVEIIVADEMLNPGQFEVKPVDSEDIQINSEIVKPRIRIIIPFEYIYAVNLPDNTADKMLMRAVIEGLLNYVQVSGNYTKLTTEIINEIINRVLQPAVAKMLLFTDASLNIKLDDRNLSSIRYINNVDVSYVLDNLVSYLPKEYTIPTEIEDKKDKIKLCDDIVTALVSQITQRIVEFEGNGLLDWLIKLNEKCIQVREAQKIQIPAKIACFSDFDAEVHKLQQSEADLVATAHATRTLIEFVATKIPSGHKWPNFDDIDELLALTNQLTEWGALSETMRFGIDDPKMGLLPSGRIGTDKTLGKEALNPYSLAKTQSTLFNNIEDFESNYIQTKKIGRSVETDESKALDIAFKAEFGITLTTLSKIIGTLVNEGFTKGIACIEISEIELIKILSAIEGVSNSDINCAFNLLTLLERASIGVPPTGYSKIDIFPWRYNRSISYIRRPLVKLSKGSSEYYYYGYRHLMQFIDNLFYLLYSSKFPNIKSEEMKSWLASISGNKGNPFRESVKNWFEVNSDYEVIPHEVKMDKGVGKSHITTDRPYGDIDLLVVDHAKHIIYPIECKNIQGGRNIHEMKVEIDEYLGRDGKDKKAKMIKHVERDEWLNNNKDSLKGLVPRVDDYTIKSFILTADEIPLAYLKRDNLPLPIKSFAFLRKNGLSYLVDL